MKIYDISQEVFSCKVFPNDPPPQKRVMMRIADGEICNLSEFSMCAHNGTHVDAPYHFIDEGKRLDEVSLERFVGMAFVAEHQGSISADNARAMLQRARLFGFGGEQRILVKGDAVMTEEAAEVFAEAGILLYGNESQTVGPEDAPAAIHRIMLGREIVLLEGIRLQAVPEGVYLLNAAPLNLGGCDGAPCRAILIQLHE
ncbi:MAG: cyclase [Ruminococcaceae bacterium]|nr:cyclase [Oscillospiraceae bacterium]